MELFFEMRSELHPPYSKQVYNFFFSKVGQPQPLWLIFVLFKHNITEKLYSSAGFELGSSE